MDQSGFPPVEGALLPEGVNNEFFDFVEANASADVQRLRLAAHGRCHAFDVQLAITQIECRRKFAAKFAGLFDVRQMLVPSVLACEQATSEAVALWHAGTVAGDVAGLRVLDMTAGLGIDAMAMARGGASVTAVELDQLKSATLAHNARVCGLDSLKAVAGDSVEMLAAMAESGERVDLVFIDPHRRGDGGKKVFRLSECLPDVTTLIPFWRRMECRVIIKLSPMLDLDQALAELENVTHVWIVEHRGECKELVVEADFRSAAEITADVPVTVADVAACGSADNEFNVTAAMLKENAPIVEKAEEIEAGHYLYIPSPGMMKAGARGVLTARFPGLRMLAQSTMIFTSMWLYRSFPGRVLQIDEIPDAGALKRLRGECRNVVARNYPLAADAVRRKYRLRDGGDSYLVAARTGNANRPAMFLASPPVEEE